ncbi:glycosyltransferase family 2 protein [Sideroxydans lithotrophicus]|uniref:Glycosyl transferase family 2 n=1 Tax=Sideroxydans lithotrophicus (strain ES-1) TaxID=580332 RepID=D5CQ91_SIDLE|nr:glycosyltransferase [Sideroxydans lithotrophicus]ADE13112.1 glycosyl transferase family 2 [Sideroxydans lithotrophicus ES-1]
MTVLRARTDENIAPVISVAMPVYNGEKYLAEAIDSILKQTFSDFEFIIIDDGSTDNSLQVLKKYQERDTRIRLISRENRNLATTLNDIIDLAKGQWIARMDQDDVALPQRFERQLRWLQETDADICGSWARLFGTADTRVLKHAQSDSAVKAELLFGSPFAHPSVMMKADLVKGLRYDKAWEKCEDYDLWERAAQAGWNMTNVPEVLLLYRQHETQISTSTSNKQQALGQQIRRRYWTFIFAPMGVNQDWIDEVLKLREPSPPKFDMDKIDAIITVLLEQNTGEARAIAFDHATRLYFRAAADCLDVVTRWGRLNKRFGVGFALVTKFKLLMLSIFRIRADSAMFFRLKNLYFRITRFS